MRNRVSLSLSMFMSVLVSLVLVSVPASAAPSRPADSNPFLLLNRGLIMFL
ncbi:hypothetical protein BC739_000723 [Kutzneria viridogrisea]|uniref:Secreted protein n=2 Tax=Kutzneria TaxID=43356 RepID=W5WL72_9PSEU|nr:hypothetical protein KALB_5557 [Kutzneria albida DSM 43870]MBA8923526.1 hypothetical protein [Kutzneria viridogrisea]